MGGHLGFWGPPPLNFAWHAVLLNIVGFEEYVYQVSCFFHQLNDPVHNLLHYREVLEFNIVRQKNY